MRPLLCLFLAAHVWAGCLAHAVEGDPLIFSSRTRRTTKLGTAIAAKPERWEAKETAFILVDFRDSHGCLNAARRTEEMAEWMDRAVTVARDQGVLVIHAPTGCMKAYEGHPARQRALEAPRAANLPKDISTSLDWKDDAEKKAGPAVDDRDGGFDSTGAEQAAWEKTLKDSGRDPARPWLVENKKISLAGERDAVSESGEEIWNLLEARGIKNVIIAGLHANQGILSHPFGLRQLARHGKNVVLVRDLTDALYNPEQEPKVGHCHGTDLVIAHIEQFVCPTTSCEIFGMGEFHLPSDTRKSLALMIAEDEYSTGETLPDYAERQLADDYRLSYVIENGDAEGDFTGWKSLITCDAAIISVRRRALPKDQLEAVRSLTGSGRGVIGLRTASHAFALRNNAPPPKGRELWPKFDEEVLGGNYQDHAPASAATFALMNPAARIHTLLSGVPAAEFKTGGSLYKNTPLRGECAVLMTGRAEGLDGTEPVAWTHQSPSGGPVFYTSLGHPADFQQPAFLQLLTNAVWWTTKREIPETGAPLKPAPKSK